MTRSQKVEPGLDDLDIALGLLSIVTESMDLLSGADVPVHARMAIVEANTKMTGQVIQLWERHASKPALSLRIHLPFNAPKGRSTSAVAVLVCGANDQL